MNVSFKTRGEELDVKFFQEADAVGLYALKGHRNVGGMREFTIRCRLAGWRNNLYLWKSLHGLSSGFLIGFFCNKFRQPDEFVMEFEGIKLKSNFYFVVTMLFY